MLLATGRKHTSMVKTGQEEGELFQVNPFLPKELGLTWATGCMEKLVPRHLRPWHKEKPKRFSF